MRAYKKEYRLKSTNEIDTLEAVAWYPEKNIRGILQIVHDTCEHIGRYDSLMRTFAGDGYVVIGHSHMGHGALAKKEGRLGRFGGTNNYLHIIDDVHAVFGYILEDCKMCSIPLPNPKNGPVLRCLLGSGFGAAVVKAYIIRHSDCNAIVLCGDKGFATVLKKSLKDCKRAIKADGPAASSKQLYEKMIRHYNDHITEPRTYSWRTTSVGELNRYNADDICHVEYDLGSFQSILQLEEMFSVHDWIDSCPEYLPVYIMSGLKDPVNNYTRVLDRFLSELKYSPVKNVFFKYYKNSRHDVFFDIEAGQVSSDVVRFLDLICKQWNGA